MVMCCLNGCQGPRAWGWVCSDPSSHPDSIHNPAWRVWEKGEDREERQSEREREAAFVTAETTVFVPQHHGGTRATNVKQTKARGTSMLDTHAHTHRLPSEETQEQEVIVGSCLCWMRMEKQTMQLCACVPLHACMHTDTHNGSRQTVVGTITVNTDGRSAKYITNWTRLHGCVGCVCVRERETDHHLFRLHNFTIVWKGESKQRKQITGEEYFQCGKKVN